MKIISGGVHSNKTDKTWTLPTKNKSKQEIWHLWDKDTGKQMDYKVSD